MYDHLFPIRGKHDLGQSETNNFGGGRGHQGQDNFARCGTRLAAARGGKVQYAGYHGRAGNYVVIDGDGTGVDYAYMHLRKTPLVSTGQRVFTGQKIGEVGDTGRASGCHLHFEMWSAPGLVRGREAVRPARPRSSAGTRTASHSLSPELGSPDPTPGGAMSERERAVRPAAGGADPHRVRPVGGRRGRVGPRRLRPRVAPPRGGMSDGREATTRRRWSRSPPSPDRR